MSWHPTDRVIPPQGNPGYRLTFILQAILFWLNLELVVRMPSYLSLLGRGNNTRMCHENFRCHLCGSFCRICMWQDSCHEGRFWKLGGPSLLRDLMFSGWRSPPKYTVAGRSMNSAKFSCWLLAHCKSRSTFSSRAALQEDGPVHFPGLCSFF